MIGPVFVSRAMHEDIGQLFAVGDTASWDVGLVDGEADGWPAEALINSTVVIGPFPDRGSSSAS